MPVLWALLEALALRDAVDIDGPRDAPAAFIEKLPCCGVLLLTAKWQPIILTAASPESGGALGPTDR